MTCKICGAAMPDDATFCPSCGCNNKLNSIQKTKTQKPKQMVRFIAEVLICTVIIFFGAITAVLGAVKSCGLLMIIMGGSLLWLLIKNPKIPKQEENTTQYKLQGASRWILIIVCVIAAFVFMFMGFVG